MFVGRQYEIDLLWRQFELAQAGNLRVVFVAGEPGVGKTRLMDVFAQSAAAAGALTLWGGAFEAEGMPPYLPFLQALGGYVRSAPPETLQRQAGVAAPILGTILPELPARFGGVLASYPLPSEQGRLRLFEAVSDFCTAIASTQPLLLLLDDLQWADSASLDLLTFLLRQQPDRSLLVLGSYREGDAPQHSPLQRTIAELTRLRLLQRVMVAPLNAQETASLAAQFLAGPVDPEVSRLLFEHAEGNPFFSEELLRSWVESGALASTATGWTLRETIAHGLPASIVGAVQRRLERLPTATVEVLRLAAIIGRNFDLALLAEVAGQNEEVVEERLVPAVTAHLLLSDAAGRFRFAHDKTRECLYIEVVSARRKRVHGFIGRALQARGEREEGQLLADLAYHFVQSGDRQRGVTYARRAAEQALSAYAFEAAVKHYQTALNLTAREDPQRGGLLLELGRVALLANAAQTAVEALQTAQAWFEQVEDRPAAGQAAHELGRAWWHQEAIPQAHAAFQQALSLLGSQQSATTVDVLIDMSSLLALSIHQPDAGLAYGHQALELARQLEDGRMVAAAGRALGNLLVRANRLAEGLAHLEQALASALDVDDPVEATECCAGLVMGYAWNGQLKRSGQAAHQQIELALRCHATYALRHVYSLLATLHVFHGQRHEAERLLMQQQTIVERLGNPEPLAFYEFARGSLAYFWGDYAAAQRALAGAIDRLREASPDAIAWYFGYIGMVQAAQGQYPQARASIAELDRLVADLPAGTMAVAEPLNQLTMIALALGDHSRLAWLYEQLLPFRGQFHDALVDRLLGRLETLQGDWQMAEASLAAAAATARRENHIWELAETLAAQAELVLARGGPNSADQARRLLGEGIAIYHQAGHAAAESRLRRRLRSLPPQPMAQPAMAYPANLSQREVDVLRLVATGLSNRQISERLFLSEKTVANHLTGIFNKLGVDNRAAAASFALRYGLA